MVDTRGLYTGLVALMVVERLVELAISRRNQRWLQGQGAIEVGAGHYPWMVLLHTLFLASCLAEVWLLDRPFYPALSVAMLVALMVSMALRYWVISTLGRRWTTRVFCLPAEPLVGGGPYRYLRHPNYLAVVIEIIALPMVHTAWLTALAFSVANGMLLKSRIRVEEEGLSRYSEPAGERAMTTPGGDER
jgi:methyltransferase